MTAAELVDGGESLELVADVAKRITGVRPSPSAVWRWCTSGVGPGRSLKLAAACHGRRWLTTRSAFLRFIDSQTALSRMASAAEDAAEDATDESLAAAGLL